MYISKLKPRKSTKYFRIFQDRGKKCELRDAGLRGGGRGVTEKERARAFVFLFHLFEQRGSFPLFIYLLNSFLRFIFKPLYPLNNPEVIRCRFSTKRALKWNLSGKKSLNTCCPPCFSLFSVLVFANVALCVDSAWTWTSARAEGRAERAPSASTSWEDTGASVLPAPRPTPGQASAGTWTSAPAAPADGTLSAPTCPAASGAPAPLDSRVTPSKPASVSQTPPFYHFQ